MYVVDLNHVRKDDILKVGGKGANLGEMIKAGINVPEGFCITSKAYFSYIGENNIHTKIEELLKKAYKNEDKLDIYAGKIEEIIIQGKISESMKHEIIEYYTRLGKNIRVAVRSSATTEDLLEASFAGQQETFLNVYKIEDVFDKIKRCWASLWTTRAIKYRQQMGFDKEKISIAIVVQIMIEGQISGVLFTVNPTTNSKNEIMINSAYGLGEGVVSGTVTPDTYICLKNKSKVLKKYKGSKEISIVYDNVKGIKSIENSKEKRDAFTLNENYIKKLVSTGIDIEKYYGFPQDIEWTIKNDNLYILQARAITTLKHSATKIAKNTINNFIEYCPVVPYPLDFQPLLIMGEEKANVFKKIGMKMESELDMKDDGEFVIKESKLKPTIKILKIPFIFKKFMNEKNNITETEKFNKNMLLRIQKLENKKLSNCTLQELGILLQDIMKIIHEIGYVRFRYSIFPQVILGKIIEHKLKKIDKSLTEYDLLSGLKYKTWLVNEELKELSQNAKDNRDIHEFINNDISDKDEKIIMNELKEKWPGYYEQVKRFLKKNGWKSSMSYIPFSTKSWNEDLRGFLFIIKVMMQSEKNKFDTDKYRNIEEKIIEKFGKYKSERFLKQIGVYRYNHVKREESLYMIETCYGLSRGIVKEILIRIPNVLESEKDILYLTLDEVYSVCKMPKNNIQELKKKICIRKRARIKNMALWNNCEFIDEKLDCKILKGLSGSKGRISGKACIVNSVKEFNKLKKGDILVCKFTDPVWTPLFSIAKAVVTDSGGPLSHSAIVAREYGIPAVLGVGNATVLLKDGDEIVVDGDKGEVIF
ncbi:PEP/pyruvate-binding domain-containing protein [Clostridium scatologenes]|uniref:Putative phosphoenolpyruvate synthase n=1 Tax=Clostridium scatologenes TaxID=1548 RepID=A0A0E3M8A1_CLOSL|nr:PEP/pyruvate-binding domain-containing protein [Clostridium scatologenes]AKA68075.1 putative phosphoenolpyruvate synthase [Clostridium scatologenes]